MSSIYYFLLANYITKKEIGTYTDNSDSNNTITELNEIISTSKDILLNTKGDSMKNKKNKYVLDNYNIYYFITNNDTFYLSAVRKNTKFSNNENLIFELFENLEHQGIKKLVDRNGELKMVGRQNLKFCIDQAQESNSSVGTSTNNESISSYLEQGENSEHPSKIALLNTTINEISSDMKQSVQNMITNVNDMNDLDNKSAQIKDASYKFQQDAAMLERKIKCRKMLFRGVIIGVLVIFLIVILLVIF